ncbi:MAG: transketolase C-terminal domain-containing protein, partial [Gloeomargarita sp. GMQP_bins_44]
RAAIAQAKAVTDKPSLIIVETTIGYGSPNKAGTEAVHGAPLGPEEVKLTKQNLGWPLEPEFYIPDEVLRHFRQAIDKGAKAEAEWQARFAAYKQAYPEEAAEFERIMRGDLPAGWQEALAPIAETGKESTRNISKLCLNALAQAIPEFLGGSADLAHSNMTYLKGLPEFQAGSYHGRNFRFGVREHAMGAIANGMALHGGLIPYDATFLVFSDYMRPAIRLSALSRARVLHIMTHDSVALGEDGPTHQPIETLSSLRLIPNLYVIRPADARETVGAYQVALQARETPSVLVFTRQAVNPVPGTSPEGVAKGAYIVVDCGCDHPDLILIATGSELELAVQAAARLSGYKVRVVSMPCTRLFDAQPQDYRDRILPPMVRKRIAIEAGVTDFWYKYVGLDGKVLGIDRFGASAPGSVCMEKFGMTVDHLVQAAQALLG